MSARERNLRRREVRHERAVPSKGDDRFCGVCHYFASHCRCAGARLFLHDEVLRLQALLPLSPVSRKKRRRR